MSLFDRLWARIRPRHWQDLQEDDLARYAAHGRAWWERWQVEWCLYRPTAWPATFGFIVTRWPGRPGWKLMLGAAVATLYVAYRDQYEWGNEYGFQVHHRMLWWFWGHCETDYREPRWRTGSFDPVRFLLGRHRVDWTTLEEREVLVPMPEGCYRAKAKLERRRDYHDRFPRLTSRYGVGVKIDVEVGIPHDGKGENGWDCGGDATFGLSCSARSIEEAIGDLVGVSLRNRRRYGNSVAQQAGEVPELPLAPREAMRAEARS